MTGLRVTGGELRGRRLDVPRSGVRPTADRVRESLFMVLTPHLAGSRVADLFAGSGALGIEALSRGAARCDFVEAKAPVAAVLRRNLAALGLEGRSHVVVRPAVRWVSEAAVAGLRFDLVILDPPYRAPGMAALLGTLAELVATGGLVAWEHDRRAAALPPGLEAVDERRYGDTQVTLLRPATG